MGFAALLAEVVSFGGDADTIASITGQIAGTLMGRGGLPKDLNGRLPDLQELESRESQFAATVSQLLT